MYTIVGLSFSIILYHPLSFVSLWKGLAYRWPLSVSTWLFLFACTVNFTESVLQTVSVRHIARHHWTWSEWFTLWKPFAHFLVSVLLLPKLELLELESFSLWSSFFQKNFFWFFFFWKSAFTLIVSVCLCECVYVSVFCLNQIPANWKGKRKLDSLIKKNPTTKNQNFWFRSFFWAPSSKMQLSKKSRSDLEHSNFKILVMLL